MSTSTEEARSEAKRARWMRDTGRCPDCGGDLDEGDHPDDACGQPPEEQPTCGICLRPIPVMSDLPLCPTCSATARAHGRLEQAKHEWEADGRPD